MRVLCAIPGYNEEVAIGSVVLRARPFVDQVLVVDDGSKDRTADVAERAGATVIRHGQNRGYGAAYRTMWDYARDQGFDVLVTLDGDGQHDPEDIPALVERIRQGDEYVIGARWGDKTQMPIWRRVGKRVLDYGTALASGPQTATGPKITDSQSGFKAYSRKAIEEIYPSDEGMAITSMLLVQAVQKGLKIGETPINCRYDVDGSSQGPVRHAAGVLNQILMQVGILHPLLYLGLPGIVAGIGGIAATVYAQTLIEAEPTRAVGWFAAGSLLVSIGVLGVFTGLLFNLLPRSIAHNVRRLVPREPREPR